MQQTVFSDIIAKVLVLVNAILDQFVTGVTYTSGNLLNCVPASYTGGALTACGQSLVYQLPLLLTQGVGFLNGTLVALGIS
jgi:hypothetical protein